LWKNVPFLKSFLSNISELSIEVLNLDVPTKHQTFTGKYVRASTCKQKNDHRVDGDARAK
jgi:hypothetical protein